MIPPLRQGPPILLDGAMATELAQRGFELRAPLFSARALIDAPELVTQIHLDYLRAGAQILTTDSFGLHVDALAAAGLGPRQAELARRSVALVEAVRAEARSLPGRAHRFRIAGAIPPRPRTASPEPALARVEYRRYADLLAEAGADLILLETFDRLDEAALALEGLADLDLPVWLSLSAGAPVPGSNRPDGARLTSGDPLRDLPRAWTAGRRPDAALINCTQIDAVPAALDALDAAVGPDPGLPLGLAPHLGKRRYDGVWIDRIVDPEVFAEQIHAWMQSRPNYVLAGACCGSRPSYIAAMKRWLLPDEDARERAFIRLAQLIP